ncbi:MAG: hypothetical protein WAU91_15175, partial [Desulfatitalea sp.]
LPFIARLAELFSVPILYVTHAWEEIVDLADTLVLIESGQVTAAGRLEDMMARADVKGGGFQMLFPRIMPDCIQGGSS